MGVQVRHLVVTGVAAVMQQARRASFERPELGMELNGAAPRLPGAAGKPPNFIRVIRRRFSPSWGKGRPDRLHLVLEVVWQFVARGRFLIDDDEQVSLRYGERVYGETNIWRFRHGWRLLCMCGVAFRRLKMI